MAILFYKRSDGTEKVLEVGDHPLVIGRLAESDIPVSDSFISRVHCNIFYSNHQFHLKDVGSANGTYRNGARIFECTLSPNDRIQVGNTTLVFEIDSDAGRVILREHPSVRPSSANFRATGYIPLPLKVGTPS